jgi:hypothetical protein
MARSDVLLESLVSYYSTLGMDAVGLLRATREDLRTESLDWKRVASRAVSMVVGCVRGLWSAALVSGSPRFQRYSSAFALIRTRIPTSSDAGAGQQGPDDHPLLASAAAKRCRED